MMTISVQELERELPAIMERKLNPKASYHTDLPDVSEIPAPLRPGQCNWQPLPHLPLWSRVTWGSTTPCLNKRNRILFPTKWLRRQIKIEFHGYISPKITLFSNILLFYCSRWIIALCGDTE